MGIGDLSEVCMTERRWHSGAVCCRPWGVLAMNSRTCCKHLKSMSRGGHVCRSCKPKIWQQALAIGYFAPVVSVLRLILDRNRPGKIILSTPGSMHGSYFDIPTSREIYNTRDRRIMQHLCKAEYRLLSWSESQLPHVK